MANNILDVKKYSPRSSDVFFFDNNIWMYLFCPLGNFNKNRQRYYSAFLQSIQTANGSIFINSLILSEFSNRYLRMDFEQWKKENNIYSADFKKDFIGTERYEVTAAEIKLNIKQILKICEKSSDNFNAIDIDKVLSHLTSIDFNDSYYIEMAQFSKWKFVTDDSDFIDYKNHNLEIYTLIES